MWAIHWASDRGLAEMVTCLINYGADVNAQDEDLQTPLHYACSVGHTEVIKILLSQDDIDITLKDSDGKTAMDTIEDNHIKELFNKSEI
jgi:ankyrin repeat protein